MTTVDIQVHIIKVDLEGHDALRAEEDQPVGETVEEATGVLIQPNSDGGTPDPREAKLRIKAAGVAGLTGEIDYGPSFGKLSVDGVALTQRFYPVDINENADTELGEVVPIGEWELADTLTATLTVKDASGNTIGSDAVKFTVINATPVRLEPVTVDANEQGLIFNPCGVAMNGLAMYKVDVVPAGIVPDSAIHWSIASGDVKFYQSYNTGRTAIIRGGNTPDSDFKLEVIVDGLPSTYKPYIYGRVLALKTVQVRAYVICDANGVEAVSRSTINAWIAEANRIYKQVAMTFMLKSVNSVTNQDWFVIKDNVAFYDMTTYKMDTGGLEAYFVSSIYNGGGLHCAGGLAIQAGSGIRRANVLAHELGHACGLKDVYSDARDQSPVGNYLLGGEPNWSGGDKTGYYSPSLMHNDILKRLLMHGWLMDNTFQDIPVSGVSDFHEAFPLSFSKSVGLNSMGDRQPRH